MKKQKICWRYCLLEIILLGKEIMGLRRLRGRKNNKRTGIHHEGAEFSKGKKKKM